MNSPGGSGPLTRPAIEVDRLRVVRGGRLVLDDVSFTVPAGQVTGLIGPSGGGKTTLIRAIVGVQIVAGGTISVLGEPAGTASLRDRVAYATQDASVYGDLTVRENLRYFGQVLGAPADDVDRVVGQVDCAATCGTCSTASPPVAPPCSSPAT